MPSRRRHQSNSGGKPLSVTGYSEPDRRSRTDIVALCRQVPGVNLSVGYYGEHTARERLDIREWRHTLAVCRRWLAQTPLPAFRLEADRE